MDLFVRPTRWAKARSITSFSGGTAVLMRAMLGFSVASVLSALLTPPDQFHFKLRDGLIGLIGAIVAAILVPLLTFVVNWIRASRLIAEDEAKHYQAQAGAIDAELKSVKQNISATWTLFAQSFLAYENAQANLVSANGIDNWTVSNITPSSFNSLRILCADVVSTLRVERGDLELPETIFASHDSINGWLYFLMFMADSQALNPDPPGKRATSIRSLGEVSSRACLAWKRRLDQGSRI